MVVTGVVMIAIFQCLYKLNTGHNFLALVEESCISNCKSACKLPLCQDRTVLVPFTHSLHNVMQQTSPVLQQLVSATLNPALTKVLPCALLTFTKYSVTQYS